MITLKRKTAVKYGLAIALLKNKSKDRVKKLKRLVEGWS